MTQPAISLIVPTRNRDRVLRRCLESVRAQRFDPAGFEVLVCDDGSEGDVAAQVEAARLRCATRVLTQAPAGPAAARNLGLAAARAELLLFLNDDSVLAPDCVAAHVFTQRKQPGAALAVLGSFSLLPEHTETAFGHLLEAAGLLFPYPRMREGERYDHMSFFTCNLSISRAAVLDAGGFDADFRYPAAEDVELGLRLDRKGGRVLYAPHCRAGHDHAFDVRGFCEMQRVRGHGTITLFHKHPETVYLTSGLRRELLDFAAQPDAAKAFETEVVEPLIDRIERFDAEQCGREPSKRARIANAIFPWVRQLQTHFAQQGYLSNPLFRDVALGD